MKTLVIYVLLLLGIAVCPCFLVYGILRSEAETEQYEQEKLQYTIQQNKLLNVERQRLYNEWTTTHDTTLRAIKSIKKRPKYDKYGYYAKTGKLLCKKHYAHDLVCEPEEKWITTRYVIIGYEKDTIWTNYNVTREDWLKRAQNHVDYVISKKHIPEFHEKQASFASTDSFWYTLCLFAIIGLFSLYKFINKIENAWRLRKQKRKIIRENSNSTYTNTRIDKKYEPVNISSINKVDNADTLLFEVAAWAHECRGDLGLTASAVQRHFCVGYSRAGKIVDQLYQLHVIGPSKANGQPRDIIMSIDDIMQMQRCGKFS